MEVSRMEFNTKEELIAFLTDLQGKIDNMQETVDKLAPVKEEEEESNNKEGGQEEELSDEEVSEIDKLLQED